MRARVRVRLYASWFEPAGMTEKEQNQKSIFRHGVDLSLNEWDKNRDEIDGEAH